MESTAYLKFLRMSPRKVRLVADLVKGKMVDDAIELLRNTNKAAATPIRKLVHSAEANLIAEEGSANIRDAGLYVANIQVNEGPTLKRMRPRAQGRAFMIRKRTSHIIVTVRNKYEIQKETS